MSEPKPSATGTTIPTDLTELDQWVLWRYEKKPGSGKPTKVPYQPNNKRAMSNEKATWRSYEEVCAAYNRNGRSFSGIGFVFTPDDPYVGIDLDDCLDDKGLLKEWAIKIIQAFFDTYSEISPSGKGVKIFAKGKLPGKGHRHDFGDHAVEMYDQGHFFTVTGNVFNEAPLEIENHENDIERLYRAISGNPATSTPANESHKILKGQRHNTLVSLAGTMRRRGMSPEAIEAALWVENTQRCDPPYDRAHIHKLAQSSIEWQPEQARNGNNLDDVKHAPTILSVADLFALDVPEPSLMIEKFLPAAGATLIFGAPKSNKTLVAIQAGIAVATAQPLLDFYRVLRPGPVLLVEQDDPAGAASVKTILQRSPLPVTEAPFFLAPRVPFSFGDQFITWLESEITQRSLRLCILDSYTALRGSRGSGVDIVKAEQSDLTMLDELAKRTETAVLIVHHASKGSASLDWSDRAAGTYAMGAATEAQIHLSRFADLDSNAPERLIRVRGRHLEGMEMVLRFRKETLDHEHVLEGGAAPYFPLLVQIRTAFDNRSFGAKELSHTTGVSRATAHRQIDRLYRSGALRKKSFGEYTADMVRL